MVISAKANRGSPILTAQAIDEIEQTLGDVTRWGLVGCPENSPVSFSLRKCPGKFQPFLQQNRFVSPSSATPSKVSSSSSPADGFPRLRHPEDLYPDNPHGYPVPPAFLHNWELPNRARAQLRVNPANSARVLGYTGPPLGSRPRPTPAVAVPIARPLPLLPVLPSSSQASATPTTMTASFTYYPMMSPYEAEASLDSDWLLRPQAEARMFPALDHELLSAEQAAAAVTAATRVRNTIFIDRGFDVENIGAGVGSRSSSCYEEKVDGGDWAAIGVGEGRG
ncbi:hypothetical protein N658DRAFT_485869 [Parathielavia hyrcaniae]|uniref:Uncharacterized protein n=1 Tax=Parathielavia hyrcaniae TaxID=113614 RepID=A0AAN6Q792_9PEZI|nr:hypothetical protein N658DRAFT_485869 [Parathielavia hyrcaniae]